MTEEHRRKISQSNKGQTPWNKGKTNVYSEETLEKMSHSKKGKKPWITGNNWSEEVKRKISNSEKGKIVLEETKRKLSESLKEKIAWNKGLKGSYKFSEEAREKMKQTRVGMLGKKHSEESKLKMSYLRKGRLVWNKGRKNIYSKESLQKMSNAASFRVGERSSNWKGGLSFEPYCSIFSDKEFKKMILERDKNQCQSCGITRMMSIKLFGSNLNLHHINYNKKDCDPYNLLSLCVSCNSKANSNRPYYEEIYSSLMLDRR